LKAVHGKAESAGGNAEGIADEHELSGNVGDATAATSHYASVVLNRVLQAEHQFQGVVVIERYFLSHTDLRHPRAVGGTEGFALAEVDDAGNGRAKDVPVLAEQHLGVWLINNAVNKTHAQEAILINSGEGAATGERAKKISLNEGVCLGAEEGQACNLQPEPGYTDGKFRLVLFILLDADRG
jgi:hypothetical protein